jgi:hypothetical protein
MVQYKRFPSSIVRICFWLFLLFLTSGITIGTAQTGEREPAGAAIFPDNHGKGDPGATVIYEHTVRNVGNGADTFDLTADSSEGWFTTVSPDIVTLNGQQTTTILVTVVVSVNAQQGDVDVTTVTVTSQMNPGISDFATDTTVVPIPMFLPVMSNNAGEESPDCQLVVAPPNNPPGVDLVVTAISLNPNPPQAGQAAVVRVTVKNQGMADVTPGNNFIIDFYDDPAPEPPGPFQPGNIFWGVQGVDFTAGESLTLVSTFTFDSGFHHLYAQIDTDGIVNESNENNNVYGCLGLTVN